MLIILSSRPKLIEAKLGAISWEPLSFWSRLKRTITARKTVVKLILPRETIFLRRDALYLPVQNEGDTLYIRLKHSPRYTSLWRPVTPLSGLPKSRENYCWRRTTANGIGWIQLAGTEGTMADMHKPEEESSVTNIRTHKRHTREYSRHWLAGNPWEREWNWPFVI